MKNSVLSEIKYTFLLLFNSLLVVNSFGQKKMREDLYTYTNGLFSEKKLHVILCSPFHIDTINGVVHRSLRVNENKLELTCEAEPLSENHSIPFSYISVNGKKIDSIYSGNTDGYTEKISSGLDFDTPPYFFSLNSVNYFIIPCGFKNCNGSACRITIYYLIKFTSVSYEVYYFKINEAPFQMLFRTDNEDNLYFIDITDSFSDINSFNSQEQKKVSLYNKKVYIKMYPILFNSLKRKWIILKDKNDKEYYILIETNNLEWHTNEVYKIIKSHWPSKL